MSAKLFRAYGTCVNCDRPIVQVEGIWFHFMPQVRWCTKLKWWERLIGRFKIAKPKSSEFEYTLFDD